MEYKPGDLVKVNVNNDLYKNKLYKVIQHEKQISPNPRIFLPDIVKLETPNGYHLAMHPSDLELVRRIDWDKSIDEIMDL